MDELLRDVPAQTQADDGEVVELQCVEQGDDVVHGCAEREGTVDTGLTVRPQVRHDDPVPRPERVHLGLPRTVVERGTVQEDQRRTRVVATRPVADGRVGAHQLVSFHGFTFVSATGEPT